MVTKGLALQLSVNIKSITNLRYFWESIYYCAESVVWRYSEKRAFLEKT